MPTQLKSPGAFFQEPIMHMVTLSLHIIFYSQEATVSPVIITHLAWDTGANSQKLISACCYSH